MRRRWGITVQGAVLMMLGPSVVARAQTEQPPTAGFPDDAPAEPAPAEPAPVEPLPDDAPPADSNEPVPAPVQPAPAPPTQSPSAPPDASPTPYTPSAPGPAPSYPPAQGQPPPPTYPRTAPPPGGYGQGYPPGGYGQGYPPGYYEPPPPPPRRPTRHRHDGFYLRVSLGPAFMRYDVEASGGGAQGKGGAVGGSLLLGGTPATGLVVGGGVFVHVAPNADFDQTSTDFAAGSQVTGVFLDYFPDETDNLHFGGMLGFGATVIESDTDDSTDIGVGFAGWVGHGFWTGDQGSLGVDLQLTHARATGPFSRVDNVTTVGIGFTGLWQ